MDIRLFFSFGILTLTSYLENGYEEEQLSAEVLQEAVLQTKAEDALAKRELHLLSADAERMMKFQAK